MGLAWDDTIAALASAPGIAARGILRISGPQLQDCLTRCLIAVDEHIWQARQAISRPAILRLPHGQPLSGRLYLWPTHHSYTRQPTAELHLPGAPPLLDAALHVLCASGARLAQPGEFTLRAFLAGRLDLTQAEAVLGIIDARSRQEMDVALRQLAGGLADPLHALRDRLLDLLAHLEAGLDFVEDDIEFISADSLDEELAAALRQLQTLLDNFRARLTSDDGYRVVLAGWPNTGKSSLLNALAESPLALVSPEAGTTRDYVTARVQLDQLPLLLIDTAGQDPDVGTGTVDTAAQQAATRQADAAHVTLFCLDGTRALNAWEQQRLRELGNSSHLLVRTKADLQGFTELPPALSVSSVSGQGLTELRTALRDKLVECSAISGEALASTAARCRDSLAQAADCLTAARQILAHRGGEELIAAELRLSLDHLGRTVGAVVTDDLLDRIFSRFCIGK
jgi:tRNA modification GTPase